MKYGYTGNAPLFLPDLHRVVQPGDEIESDIAIRHPDFKELKPRPERPAKED